MNEEEQDRTFNEEQRALFEQRDETGEKTRPRTPGAQSAPATVAPDVVEQPAAGEERTDDEDDDGPLIRRVE